MKYIKLYEENKQFSELDEDVFYVTVHGDEGGFSNHVMNNWEIFTISDNNHIKKACGDNAEISDTYYTISNRDADYYSLHIRIEDDYTLIFLQIFKLKDEWYYIEFSDVISPNHDEKYYKCDQLEGLLDCIKTILDKSN